jgi:hypothetical protein
MILDIFDFIIMSQRMFKEDSTLSYERWNDWMKDMFSSSHLLSEVYKKYEEWYPYEMKKIYQKYEECKKEKSQQSIK